MLCTHKNISKCPSLDNHGRFWCTCSKINYSTQRHTVNNKSADIKEGICLRMLCTDVVCVYPTPCEKEMDYGIFYMKWQTRCLVIDYMSNLGVWVAVNPAYTGIPVTNAQKTPNPLLCFCGSLLVHWPPKLLDFWGFHYRMIMFGTCPIPQTLDVAKVSFQS